MTRIQDLGHEIRRARQAQGLTQAGLASSVGLSRTTINQLENGLVRDVGVRKILSILARLGLAIHVQPADTPAPADFVRLACTAASVAFRTSLAEDELIWAFLTGKIPSRKRPHLRTLLDEGDPALLRGLFTQVARWSSRRRIAANIAKIANELGIPRERTAEWMKNG
jgi:transcriptional regulator with XRE-family HTH domain